MNNNLIFDVGLHKGEDSLYYLTKGFRVIGIDADHSLIENARNYFSKYLMSNQLILLNFALSNNDDEELDFHISRLPEWNSLKKSISDRDGMYKETIKVKSKKLSSIMIEFGVPSYCKIDVEAADKVCLETLSDLDELPKYISVETECLGEFETETEEQALDTLNILNKLGYRRYKLVDQRSLCVLQPDKAFYRNVGLFLRMINKSKRLSRTYARLQSKLGIGKTYRDKLSDKFGFTFEGGSTGPFGEDLDFKWLDYETAKRTLLFHRDSYAKLREATSYGFWCDWHAKLE
jgi:FkbM family methyltransferase